MLLLPGGDVGLQTPLLAVFQVGGAPVAGICNEGIRQLTCVGLDPLQHGQQVYHVAWPVGDADCHDDLMVTIGGGLVVVALNPADRSLEDVAFRVGEIPLSCALGFPSASLGTVRFGIADGSVLAAATVLSSRPTASASSITNF